PLCLETQSTGGEYAGSHRWRRENPERATANTATRYAADQTRIPHPCTYAPPKGPSWSRKPVRPDAFSVIIRNASWYRASKGSAQAAMVEACFTACEFSE